MKFTHPIIAVSIAIMLIALLMFSWSLSKRVPDNGPAEQNIALGKPCDASQIAWEDNDYNAPPITDSHGLQCEVYNQTPSTSNSTSGVWGYPNAMVIPGFLSSPTEFGAVTQTWDTYRSPDGTFTFRHPSGWSILSWMSPPNGSSSIMVLEGPYSNAGYGFEIAYYPATFQNTDLYRAINSIPDNTMSYESSIPGDIAPLEVWPQNPLVGAFYLVNHFTSNGLPAVTLESMDMVSRGGDTYNVNAYIIGKRGYLQLSYEVGLGDAENVITGLSIASARLEE